MTNPHGTPIWYELLTTDPDASKAFYDAVIGWSVEPQPAGPMDYRMIDTGPLVQGEGSGGGGLVGGVMRLSADMQAGGAQPGWLFYICADDVDATADAIKTRGGTVHMAPFDLPGVGRMAFVADPQGNPFYIMRGASEGSSTAWDPAAPGKCNWNELNTTDHPAADAFYADVFGWSYPGGMPIGEAGEYRFVQAGEHTIGATMPVQGDTPPRWYFYFGVRDIDAAADAIRANGGTVLQEPLEVPGGSHVLFASDPHGVRFGAVAPGRGLR